MKKLFLKLFICVLIVHGSSTIYGNENFTIPETKPGWQTALVDAAGALEGAEIGSVLGPWGALGGGLICGAGASIGFAGKNAVNLYNDVNPIGKIGIFHNMIVIDYFNKNKNYNFDNLYSLISKNKIKYGIEKLNNNQINELISKGIQFSDNCLKSNNTVSFVLEKVGTANKEKVKKLISLFENSNSLSTCLKEIEKMSKNEVKSNFSKYFLATLYSSLQLWFITNSENIFSVNLEKDALWDDKKLCENLGVNSVTIKSGKYIIEKNKINPYGLLILNVIGNNQIENKEKLIFNGGWVLLGGYFKCDAAGAVCCIPDNLNKLEITPVYSKNKLIQLKIKFLTKGVTNGYKIE